MTPAHDFTQLAAHLKEVCADGPTYYFPNPGNWGDGLIRAGALKFFAEAGITVEEHFTRRDFMVKPAGGTLIYGGSGAWCSHWNHAVEHVTALKKKFKVVVLPSTYETSYDVPDVSFFCRDLFESQQNMPLAKFCHDMAFAIGDQYAVEAPGQGAGYFFRTDREKNASRGAIPIGNLDISNKGKHDTDVSGLFEHLNRYATIYTDRLHVAIAGCLLGKTVHLYPNAYFKIRAIYLSSMKDHFQNLVFHDAFDALPSGNSLKVDI